MNRIIMICALLMLTIQANGSGLQKPIEKHYDFDRGMHGWQVDFADLPVDYEPEAYQLDYGRLPSPVNPSKSSLSISGFNGSDDLFMFVFKKLDTGDGVLPGKQYQVTIQTELYSNAQSGCMGVGGPPGEGVTLRQARSATNQRL